MIAKKCDRCGKFYEPYCEKKRCAAKDVNGIAFVHVRTDGHLEGLKQDGHDLCHDCLGAFIDFMRYFDGTKMKGGAENE